MRDAHIVAAGSSEIARRPDDSFRQMASECVRALIADGGAEGIAALGSLWFSNSFMHAWGQPNVRGHMVMIDLSDRGVLPPRVPIHNIEGACASGSLALHAAVRDVRSGEVEVAAAIGIEKMTFPSDQPSSRGATLDLFDGCADRLSGDRFEATYRQAAATVGRDLDLGGDHSIFMDTYAIQALLHMKVYGTTQEQIAVACAKNHNFGSLNPLAQYRYRTTPDDVLKDREIAFPLTRAMCAPIGDGWAGAIVASSEWLAGQPESVRSRAVRVAGLGAAGGSYSRSTTEPSLSHTAALRAYGRAGVKPADIDVAEVHDATSFGEILQVEMLGFCAPGSGGSFVADGATSLGGTVPVNTSGGLVSKGHPIGATGLSMIYELVTQLRGEAGPRQVPRARLALAENGGGVIGLEEAACAVTILEGPS